MKRTAPALAWAWIALVISIWAASPSLRLTSSSWRELLDVALGEAARQVLEDEGDGAAALGLAELERLQQHLLGHLAQDAGEVAAVDAERDVVEGEHGALHVLGEGGVLALEVGEEALADLGRDVVHQAGDQVGRAALREVALQDREEVALDRALDRGGDRRVEGRDAGEAQDDGLGEAAVEALEHAGGDLGAELAEDDGGGLRVLGLEEAGERGRGAVVQALPDRAHLAAGAALDEAADLVLVVDDGGEELAGHLRAAGDLGAGGQELEELGDHRVEQLLVDLAEAGEGAGEALHVGLGELAQEAGGEVGADGGQDHRRLLDRGGLGAAAQRRDARLRRPGGDEGGGLGHAA